MRRLLLIAALVLAACSGAEPATTSIDPVSTTAPVTATTAEPLQPPPPHVEVNVEVSPDGHLVDGDGFSLYAFTLDVERTSSCEGPCAERWPPFLGEPQAGEGVDQELLGNSERANGALQVTYAGMPLYRFEEDAQPGDVNGHGFNDVWFLVGADGELVP